MGLKSRTIREFSPRTRSRTPGRFAPCQTALHRGDVAEELEGESGTGRLFQGTLIQHRNGRLVRELPLLLSEFAAALQRPKTGHPGVDIGHAEAL